MSLAAGARLGPYEILSPLGRGGMGEVYRARDTRLGRDVAVKVLPAESEIPTAAAALRARSARHGGAEPPNILALHDIGNENGVVYAVMELLEGETLRDGSRAGGSRCSRPSTSRFRSRAAWRPRTSAASSIAI